MTIRNGRVARKGWIRGVLLAAAGVAWAGAAPLAGAADGPSLGEARSFAVLGGSTVSNTGSTTIVRGDVGVSPGSDIVGFGPGQVTGGTYVGGDGKSDQAHADAATAYAFLAGMASLPANNLSDVDLGGMTLSPGVYRFNAAAELTGDLVLDAQGSRDALFVFQIGTSLTTAPGSSVVVIRGAKYDRSNVYWQVGSSATLDTDNEFVGNILADQSVTLNTGTSLIGRALAIHAAVTLDSNSITAPAPGSDGASGKPSQGKGRMSPSEDGPDSKSSAKVFVKHFPEHRSRQERSWFRLKTRRLDRSADYTIWADDPSTPGAELVQFDTVTTKRNGAFYYKGDTKKGDAMPFGATLADLSGMALEVRDAGGTTTILVGTVPTTSP